MVWCSLGKGFIRQYFLPEMVNLDQIGLESFSKVTVVWGRGLPLQPLGGEVAVSSSHPNLNAWFTSRVFPR